MTRRRSNAPKIPTKTSIIYEYLINLDDFVLAPDIARALKDKGVTNNHVTASLHEFKKRAAVDCMRSDDKLWWYATPATDSRTKKVEMRAQEGPRNTAGRRKTPKQA